MCRPSSLGLSQGRPRVCPRVCDKPGFAGLPLCKIRRNLGLFFVPGFHRICPRDKPGEIPGTDPGSSQDQPDKKNYVYVPFSCLKRLKIFKSLKFQARLQIFKRAAHQTPSFSGVTPANQTKERPVHELFPGGIPEQKFNVNRACFPKEKHQNSQKWAKFMNFSFWPFLWFGLPGRLLILGRELNGRGLTVQMVCSNFLLLIFCGEF